MADFHRIDLQFTGRLPDVEALKQLNNKLQEDDYDFPTLTVGGFDDERWRSPLVDLHFVLDFIHSQGYPCRGRMRREEWSEDGDLIPNSYCPNCGNWE